ncbi:endonuclease/exonuclease/phosphatase family protein [Parasalinivibrio latis]|uniref:endonuclease/exonuclease/phosphatase family protein n=1 Tax=Parasalinivibrio latis TaxID=2952610 RepID=UPI0030E398DB
MKAKLFPKVMVIFLMLVSSAPSSAFSIMTWNMEWLSDKGDITEGHRKPEDYVQLQKVVSQIDPDVVALQEVDSLKVLRKVFSPQLYDLYISDRHSREGPGNRQSLRSTQYTGFAVKRGITVIDHADNRALSLSSYFNETNLRYGTYIEIQKDGYKPLHLLSVHLKSGCFDGRNMKRYNCIKLSQQTDALGNWIRERERNNQAYMIAGDFNHYLSKTPNEVITRLNRYTREGLEPLLLTQNTRAYCKVRRINRKSKRWETHIYTRLIDHILVSQNWLGNKRYTSRQISFDPHDVMHFRLTDHCPVVVTVNE